MAAFAFLNSRADGDKDCQRQEDDGVITHVVFAFLGEASTPAEYKAGLELAIARGWLWKHASGTYVKFTPAGVACSPDGAAPVGHNGRRKTAKFMTHFGT